MHDMPGVETGTKYVFEVQQPFLPSNSQSPMRHSPIRGTFCYSESVELLSGR